MPKLYLLDIEGTTSPISFVYDVLFPYARNHMVEYVSMHAHELQSDFDLLAQENKLETSPEPPAFTKGTEAATSYLLWLMNQDRKSTVLKSIQGKIWAYGFDRGELFGEVYPDVPAALERWHSHARIAIYSSGSVQAQQYLFSHVKRGSLAPYISAYFDTHVGPKIEPASYRAIASKMELAPADILFISDAVKELDAARDAGLVTLLSVRPGNPPVADAHGHSAIHSFDGIA